MDGPLSDSEMNALLQSEIFGHLGCCDQDKPYVVPLAYIYNNNAIYGQTTEGRKTEILRKNPLVCFQVENRQETSWHSIMCWGTFEEMDFEKLGEPEVIRIVKLLTERLGKIQKNVGISIPFSFGEKATPLTVNEKKSTLFRIPITEKTGRFYRIT